MTSVRPLYVPVPYQHGIESGQAILRDGSTASVRVAQASDRAELEAFFARLDPEGRRRFFLALPVTDPGSLLGDQRVTLLALRGARIIAVGCYVVTAPGVAVTALAVDPALRRKGLGSVLLERLTVLAARQGIRRFTARTHAEYQPMLDVFRASGFEFHERRMDGQVDIELSVLPSPESVARAETRDRAATTASIRPFFYPNAVAVVGASRQPESIGYRLLDALIKSGFQGPIFPVNPKAAELLGLRVFPSVKELPQQVDLAIITVPRDAVLGVVEECGARGVRAIVVITAGFAEVNEEGRALQRTLVERVRAHGMRMVGPNCMGIINARNRLNGSFSPVYPPGGGIAMASQSGALGIAILQMVSRMELGLSTFVSVGNKADVSGNDLIQYWEEDPDTDVILLYLESFGNPRRFARLARRISHKKPIIVVKGGRTKAGRRAAGSHTAALAASDVAVEAMFRQTGVIRADTLEEMFNVAAALSSQPLPKGRRVGIVTNAGGPGILCVDACESSGLSIAEFSEATRKRLAPVLPPAASLSNPVDMIASASPDNYRRVVETVLTADEVDALIVLYIPVSPTDSKPTSDAICQAVASARASGAKDKPVLACFVAQDVQATSLSLGDEWIPAYSFPEACARALGRMASYADWRGQPPGKLLDFEDADPARAQAVVRNVFESRGGGWLLPDEVRDVLTAFKLPLAPSGSATTADQAAALAKQFGFPVAVKLLSKRITHKTEVGGVRLNLKDEAAVRRAFEEIRNSLASQPEAFDGVVVQPMVRPGVEVMAGIAEDPVFGDIVAFGLGGIHVEVLEDVRFRVTPLTDRDASEMIREIHGIKLLQGYRGHPPADLGALEETLLRLSRLAEQVPEIVELDLNPIFAYPPGQGCSIVDARIRVERIFS